MLDLPYIILLMQLIWYLRVNLCLHHKLIALNYLNLGMVAASTVEDKEAYFNMSKMHNDIVCISENKMAFDLMRWKYDHFFPNIKIHLNK